jgi:hypothetical protein
MTELMEQRKILYKVSSLKFKLVEELVEAIKHCFGDRIEVNGIRFDSNFMKIDDLFVKRIEVIPHDIAHVMIHWYPNYNISTRNDPYCSVYMLTEEEIKSLMEKVKAIKDYYLSHSPK